MVKTPCSRQPNQLSRNLESCRACLPTRQTVTMSRIYKGQKAGGRGEETELEWEKFPATGLAKTYNLDFQAELLTITIATRILDSIVGNNKFQLIFGSIYHGSDIV